MNPTKNKRSSTKEDNLIQALKEIDNFAKLTPKQVKRRLPPEILKSIFAALKILNKTLEFGDPEKKIEISKLYIDKLLNPRLIEVINSLEDEAKPKKKRKVETMEWRDPDSSDE